MSDRGLWIPSKIAPIMPGPSSTERGLPVRSTGSPTETPAEDWLRKSSSRQRTGKKASRSHHHTLSSLNMIFLLMLYIIIWEACRLILKSICLRLAFPSSLMLSCPVYAPPKLQRCKRSCQNTRETPKSLCKTWEIKCKLSSESLRYPLMKDLRVRYT